MIQKFIKIKNVGKLKDVSFDNSSWNGILGKVNAFYADNGSGKTTLTQIFKSTKNSKAAAALQQKKSFDTEDNISISYINELRQQCNYGQGKWNKYDDKIEVFDSYFVEDNVYIISLGNYADPGSYYEVVVGEEAIKTYYEIQNLVTIRKKEKTKRTNLNRRIKLATDNVVKQRLEEKIKTSQKLSLEIGKKLKTLEEKQIKEAEEFATNYLEKINKHLQRLGTDLKITNLKKVASKFIYYISVSEHELRSDTKSISLRHTLSEGEKNCLAFAFFLARLDLRNDLSERTIIFDDPISSLDANRRSISLNILTRIAKQSKMFILLSHDVHFIRDFKEKIQDALILKICKSSNSSQIVPFDVEKETLTGIFKDILILKEFADNGELSGHNPRDVVRCIRPVIEGFFRIKYYSYIKGNEWLGDFISHVRNAAEGAPFYAQKNILMDLEDINDYSKGYHHANPNYLEIPIISSELQTYCKLVFKVIEKF